MITLIKTSTLEDLKCKIGKLRVLTRLGAVRIEVLEEDNAKLREDLLSIGKELADKNKKAVDFKSMLEDAKSEIKIIRNALCEKDKTIDQLRIGYQNVEARLNVEMGKRK